MSAFDMPEFGSLSGPEFAAAVAFFQSKREAEQGMNEELLLFAHGYEPVFIAGVGEVWRGPDCSCLKERLTALWEIAYKRQTGRGEDLPPEWSEPVDLNPDDYPSPDYPPEEGAR